MPRKDIEYRKYISKIMKKAITSECIYFDSLSCSKKMARSHSIQNNRILNRISIDGDVVIIEPKSLMCESKLTITGRKIATTFVGFCQKHDKEIFQSIEDKDYINGDKEQEFLFAYRVFAKELLDKKKAIKLLNNGLNKTSNPDSVSYLCDVIYENCLGLADLNYYKSKFDNALKYRNYDIIETKTIELSKEYPLAVCSGFAIEYDFDGNRINDLSNKDESLKFLFLTVFPTEGKTHILFSFLKECSDIFDFLDRQLLQLTEKQQIDRMNILITSYCGNLILSKKNWSRMSDKSDLINQIKYSISYLKLPDDLKKKPAFNLFVNYQMRSGGSVA